jgi:hypothetical protein
MPRLPVLLALALGIAPVAGACGSAGVGVNACKTIEQARCRQVPSCPNVEVAPPDWYTSGSAVDACIRYYDTECLHGLSNATNPSSLEVSQCVAAINASCDVVAAPQASPSCSWLVPPQDEDAGDAATDGGDGDGADASGE